MNRIIACFLSLCLLTFSSHAVADVMIKDKNGQSDHTLVFRTAGKNVLFLQCPVEGSQACTPVGNASGYSLKKMTSVAKKTFYGARAETVLLSGLMVLGLLLVGGFTVIAAAGVVTSLAAGAIGTAAVSGFIAVLTGGNLFFMSKYAPNTIVQMKQSAEVTRTLKNGVTSPENHIITVSDLNQFEAFLVSVLPE